ncbi:MAG TPA: ribosome-associated translation inhibitor RaiA [Candidatus Magasanikbacteria bacterium]|jgi:putative sigma-54 modulation protein|nr:ribosome-associated translation inhibitor RaiA [Candidatus Magasanikbacteria bacterium]HQL52551.1 ribosome-associated translation inhibitor RaiA [Candidatus Magasanikbacteria bacterium]
MKINIQGTGIELTEAIKRYAIEKTKSLEKYFDNIQQADIDVGMNTQRHNKGKIYYAEINLSVPGKVLRVVKESEDLYKSIDKVRDHFKVELEKLKGKMREIDRKDLRNQKGYQVE